MLARGTTEDYPGTTYSMAELVAENTTLSTNYENIIYPAVSETASDSYFIGRAAVGSQVNSYVAACPKSRIVLISYSQGALIVGDALAGGGGDSTLGNATEPLISDEVSKHSISPPLDTFPILCYLLDLHIRNTNSLPNSLRQRLLRQSATCPIPTLQSGEQHLERYRSECFASPCPRAFSFFLTNIPITTEIPPSRLPNQLPPRPLPSCHCGLVQ